MALLLGNVLNVKQLMVKEFITLAHYPESLIKCSRCEDLTPESELLELHAWWVCGNCYDEL